MTRLYGRAEGRSRAYGAVKHRPEIKMSLVSGLSTCGLVGAYEFEGYLDKHTFYYYLKDILFPELKKGQILIMDNLSSHKNELVDELASEKGIKIIYFPAYSPDLNPIEKYWSIFKSYLRKWGGRTKNQVQLYMTKAIELIEKMPMINLFKDCWNM